jgi:hypothetical protein
VKKDSREAISAPQQDNLDTAQRVAANARRGIFMTKQRIMFIL